MCDVCYRRWKQRESYKRKKNGVVRHPGQKRFAICHPDRKYHSKGLCTSCTATKWLANKVKNDKIHHDKRKQKLRDYYHLPNSKQRNRWYMKKYGICINDYNKILEMQNGNCAVCNQKTTIKLSVDHNHNTKTVRGLLCTYCNYLLGVLEKKGEQFFINLIRYYKKYSIIVTPEVVS